MTAREGRARSVLAIQHVAIETTGLIGDLLAEAAAEVETVRVFAGDPVPGAPGARDALVVMGGPMGVYEGDRHPHLAQEIALIRRAIEEGVPVLGVCLGSQLLAAALGARVRPAAKELGWLPVTLTPEGRSDPLWADAPDSFTAFHWHGDAFDLPAGAMPLASSALTACQAFRQGPHVGLLFHMEMDAAIVGALAETDRASGYADEAAARRAIEEAPRRLPAMREVARGVFGRWVRAIDRDRLRA